ncbi:myotubularin-related protein 3 isoform X1 [Schistocerca nitens]|uniref:myotubularin-related protein 3 isoform X1 n=1 Tax=Schistocerca nitens TaxID=7011 RepID=UPI002117DCCF|nr:myotubularin-related protein 3 isoform X1 [Schistocerca nitens]XP_049792986.1 myotubularin-related protein 3 isoform X1 [Schistocerca nitens]
MDGSEQPSSLQSLCHVRACELFPKSSPEIEDEKLTVPYEPICGESVEYIGRTTEGVLALSNYRIYLQLKDTSYNIPLGLIELLEVRDIFFLHIACKDARSVRCTFSTNEHCLEWYRRLHRLTSPPKNIEQFFAFAFYAWAHEAGGEETSSRLGGPSPSQSCTFRAEVERLQFDVHGAWRISQANADHSLCPSYPRQLLVPACISDDTLEGAARFRSARRVPAVVWRHTGNGAVIARCSQPEVGWLGWRSAEDEDLIKAIADACAYDRGRQTMLDLGGTSTPTENGSACVPSDCDGSSNHVESTSPNEPGKKVLIMDARSYTTAVANRARGGGCECPEYYPSCDIQFMNLANIHSIRKSFHAVRNLCATAADQPNWYSLLEGTRWLQHMSGLLRAAVTVASAVHVDGRPVLVHCSDGWDRTPQIVALAELLLDPHYRTLDGFQVLCEREWLDFGHKFADRCGHTVGGDDQNERCPVFLQWLDCVHQILLQNPCNFQFSHSYLVKLAQHTYSNLFGTFLCNTAQEREKANVYGRTFSVWKFLKSPNFRNHLYTRKDEPLWPSFSVRDLVLWSEVYLGTSESTATPHAGSEASSTSVPLSGGMIVGADVTSQGDSGHSSGANSGVPTSPLPKTRSYGDLMVAADHRSQRRSSDPSIAVDLLKLEGLNDAVTAEEVSAAAVSKTDNRQKQIIMHDLCLGDEDSSDSTSDPGFIDAPRAAFDDEDDENEESTTESRSEATQLCATTVPEPSQESACESADSLNVALPPEAAGSTAVAVAESSTETLVAEALVPTPCSSGSSTPPHLSADVCQSCRARTGANGSGKTSRYSTPPPCSSLSRTPSSGYPATPVDECRPAQSNTGTGISGTASGPGCRLDDVDGLAHVRNEVQTRLQQIIADHKAKEESLQRELHTTRLALMQQVCHQCNQTNIERPDDVGSLPESVCSGEQPSAGESLPSDVSWENLEERDAGPTLWVPDHAVNRCMGCDTEFWLGRRKHHCRNCGKIFCYDCSEFVMPLPNEQLYDPVRVCTGCFARLQEAAVPQPSSRTALPQVSLVRPQQGISLGSESGAYPLRPGPPAENCKQATASDHVAKCSKSAVTAAST